MTDENNDVDKNNDVILHQPKKRVCKKLPPVTGKMVKKPNKQELAPAQIQAMQRLKKHVK